VGIATHRSQSIRDLSGLAPPQRHGTPYPCLIGIWPLTRHGDDVEMCAAIEDYLDLRPEQL
jgi:hypothetical protein